MYCYNQLIYNSFYLPYFAVKLIQSLFEKLIIQKKYELKRKTNNRYYKKR